MKKTRLVLPVLSLAAQPGAPAAGMRARPVHIEIDAPLPKDLPSDLMLGNNEGGGYAVTYLVRGKGISGIDKAEFWTGRRTETVSF